jgi:anti-sigma B factor antagonist
MSFRAVTRRNGDVTVVDVVGQITSDEAGALHDLLHDLFGKGQRNILLNLAEVTHLDSSGIGELVRIHTKFCRDGGTLKMLQLSARVQDLLRRINLYTVFEDYPDEGEALKSFGKGA